MQEEYSTYGLEGMIPSYLYLIGHVLIGLLASLKHNSRQNRRVLNTSAEKKE